MTDKNSFILAKPFELIIDRDHAPLPRSVHESGRFSSLGHVREGIGLD